MSMQHSPICVQLRRRFLITLETDSSRTQLHLLLCIYELKHKGVIASGDVEMIERKADMTQQNQKSIRK